MGRAYYSNSIKNFLTEKEETVKGYLADQSHGSVNPSDMEAWGGEIQLMQYCLKNLDGMIFFEFSIPRMGSRIDVVLVIGPVVFVLEFKVGANQFSGYGLDQVCDYALDLKNFHETSHDCLIAPILIATKAKEEAHTQAISPSQDNLLAPIKATPDNLREIIDSVLMFSDGTPVDGAAWEKGRYSPTPTIIEAALALYRGHSVHEISRSDAGAKNLHATSDAISQVIESARAETQKAICFVTGVPGSGKTLIGLNIATKHLSQDENTYSVFLSGNGPLVKILQEALARDLVARKKQDGERITKQQALSKVKAFVQNVHHYRDEYLGNDNPPVDHVALFDEAQRAWDTKQTSGFMVRKRKVSDFSMSEPEFLISCVDRHEDWGVIVCLVGGGQEIHTGEGGIGEWIDAINKRFPHWHINISSRLTDSEYEAGGVLKLIKSRPNVHTRDDLHLSVSMRSFRAEHVSRLIKQLLDTEPAGAAETLNQLKGKYPIKITRSFRKAKEWVKQKARGSERYGMIVSSKAERLKPYAVDVRSPMDPVHWFLNGKEDVRSSYYLEHVATEFSVQGLELDWACVAWDADFRYTPNGWSHHEFKGAKWLKVRQEQRRIYQKNAYRVLLTRARQGMVIVVPEGDTKDPTRLPAFYDLTFEYLKTIGFVEL